MCSTPKTPKIPEPPEAPDPIPEVVNPELRTGDDNKRVSSRRGKSALKIDLNAPSLAIPT